MNDKLAVIVVMLMIIFCHFVGNKIGEIVYEKSLIKEKLYGIEFNSQTWKK